MRHELSDLASLADLADLFDVVPSAVTNWRKRHADFPLPLATVARGNTPLFSRGAAVAWWRAHHAATLATAERIK